MSGDSTLAEALNPVRAALLAAAGRDAQLRRDQAERAEAEALAAASAQAEQIRRQAREGGAADAQAGLRAERARAGRNARAEILLARRHSYEALREAARGAVAALRDEPAYPQTRQRMIDLVHELLGPQAEICEATGGGVIGEVPGRRLDLSLAGFAARAVDAVAAQMTGTEP